MMVIDGSPHPEVKRKIEEHMEAIKALLGPKTRAKLQLRYLVDLPATVKDGVSTRQVPAWWIFHMKDADFDDEFAIEGQMALYDALMPPR